MKKAKFMFKYNNKMLPISLNDYFFELETVLYSNTTLGKKSVMSIYLQIYSRTESRRKALYYLRLKAPVRKEIFISLEQLNSDVALL